MPLANEHVTLLHDHYKESFSLIREREGQRDKLFLRLLLFYAVLIIEIQLPANAGHVLHSFSILGNTINLQPIPFGLLLDASWVFLAAFILRYCQTAITIERQYTYLHMVEDRMSETLGNNQLYRREGRAYLSRYPWLLAWAWICYTALFPAALFSATTYLYVVEAMHLQNGWTSKTFDGVFALSIVITLTLYRLLPGVLRIVYRLPKTAEGTPG